MQRRRAHRLEREGGASGRRCLGRRADEEGGAADEEGGEEEERAEEEARRQRGGRRAVADEVDGRRQRRLEQRGAQRAPRFLLGRRVGRVPPRVAEPAAAERRAPADAAEEQRGGGDDEGDADQQADPHPQPDRRLARHEDRRQAEHVQHVGRAAEREGVHADGAAGGAQRARAPRAAGARLGAGDVRREVERGAAEHAHREQRAHGLRRELQEEFGQRHREGSAHEAHPQHADDQQREHALRSAEGRAPTHAPPEAAADGGRPRRGQPPAEDPACAFECEERREHDGARHEPPRNPAWVVVGVAVRSRRQRRQRVRRRRRRRRPRRRWWRRRRRLRAWGRLHRARLQSGVAAIGGVQPERDQGEEHHGEAAYWSSRFRRSCKSRGLQSTAPATPASSRQCQPARPCVTRQPSARKTGRNAAYSNYIGGVLSTETRVPPRHECPRPSLGNVTA